MSYFNKIGLPTFYDDRGKLSVLEKEVPFKIERIFWIYDSDGQIRGGHRHHNTTQVLISIKGIVSIYMNDGNHEETILLSNSNECLLVEPKDWHTMTFEKDAILLVLASHPYNENDYIYDAYPSC
jgi:dTDP-4-dehydrorhamnose 3,5-epimerase-like enzyme